VPRRAMDYRRWMNDLVVGVFPVEYCKGKIGSVVSEIVQKCWRDPVCHTADGRGEVRIVVLRWDYVPLIEAGLQLPYII